MLCLIELKIFVSPSYQAICLTALAFVSRIRSKMPFLCCTSVRLTYSGLSNRDYLQTILLHWGCLRFDWTNHQILYWVKGCHKQQTSTLWNKFCDVTLQALIAVESGSLFDAALICHYHLLIDLYAICNSLAVVLAVSWLLYVCNGYLFRFVANQPTVQSANAA